MGCSCGFGPHQRCCGASGAERREARQEQKRHGRARGVHRAAGLVLLLLPIVSDVCDQHFPSLPELLPVEFLVSLEFVGGKHVARGRAPAAGRQVHGE